MASNLACDTDLYSIDRQFVEAFRLLQGGDSLLFASDQEELQDLIINLNIARWAKNIVEKWVFVQNLQD